MEVQTLNNIFKQKYRKGGFVLNPDEVKEFKKQRRSKYKKSIMKTVLFCVFCLVYIVSVFHLTIGQDFDYQKIYNFIEQVFRWLFDFCILLIICFLPIGVWKLIKRF